MARNGLLLPPEREKADAEASLPRRFVSPVDPALPIKEEAVAIDPTTLTPWLSSSTSPNA